MASSTSLKKVEGMNGLHVYPALFFGATYYVGKFIEEPGFGGFYSYQGSEHKSQPVKIYKDVDQAVFKTYATGDALDDEMFNVLLVNKPEHNGLTASSCFFPGKTYGKAVFQGEKIVGFFTPMLAKKKKRIAVIFYFSILS